MTPAETLRHADVIAEGRSPNGRFFVPYPTGLLRTLVRAPLAAQRLGLGALLPPLHLMVLTTRGRKSGLPRRTAIEFRRHGRKVYVVSGWGARPDWYQNLLVNPQATVQIGGRALAARAQVVTDPAEALRALYLFRRVAPARYDAVLGAIIEATVNTRTLPDVSAQFTIVRLDLNDSPPPLPPLPADLIWLWPVAGLAALILLLGWRGHRA